MPCKHEETKVVGSIGDKGDVRQTVCTAEDCQFIVKEEILVKRDDGGEFWRTRGVKVEDQPEIFEFAGKDGKKAVPREKIFSAREMALLAVRVREETVGKESRLLVKKVLDKCVEHVLDGEYNYIVTPEDNVPGEILTLTIKELKAQGYRVKKIPEPGKGVWIEVKWSIRTPQKKKKTKGKNSEIRIGRRGTTDTTSARQQAAATAHRKAALKVRSKLPT